MGAISDEERKRVMDTVDDLVKDFLYYDRKEDEDLPSGRIEALVEQAEVAGEDLIEDICARFRSQLLDGLGYEEEPQGGDDE